jgi:hypothetical protein
MYQWQLLDEQKSEVDNLVSISLYMFRLLMYFIPISCVEYRKWPGFSISFSKIANSNLYSIVSCEVSFFAWLRVCALPDDEDDVGNAEAGQQHREHIPHTPATRSLSLLHILRTIL